MAFPMAFYFTFGTVNTEGSTTVDHNFAASSIFAHASLQMVSLNSDEGAASTRVSQFVDAAGAHDVKEGAIFRGKKFGHSSDVTRVTYRLFTKDCIARVISITEFF